MRLKTDNYLKIYTYSWSIIPLSFLQETIKKRCFNKSYNLNAYINLEGPKWFYKNHFKNMFHNIFLRTYFLSNSAQLSERIYCILNNIKKEKLCYCGKQLNFEFWSRGYRSFCSVKCKANDKKLQDLVRTNNIKKYGVDHISKIPAVKSKKKQTLYNNYGVTSNFALVTKKKKEENVLKCRATKTKNGSIIDFNLLPEKKRYYRLVDLHTAKSLREHIIKDVNKRGRAGELGAYHLDHKISKYDGFNKGILPEIIGSIFNLECIPWEENAQKNRHSNQTLNEITVKYYEKIRQQSFRTWPRSLCNRE